MDRKVRKPFAVLTSAALGASLVLAPATPAAWAAGAGTAASAVASVKLSFPDVPENHWARGHIAKLAAAGVITGYATGDFRPNQNVSQQEAIVMVVRMMGLEEEAQASPDAVTGLGEDPFYSKYVKIAADYRYINLLEETIAAQNGTEPWGKRPASREWISKLIVRALGEEPSASSTLPFADADEVSSEMAGFVAKSHELGLVTGIVEKGNTNFKPKDPVTRAQLATILSRADQYIEDDPEVYYSGYVASRSGTTLQLRSASGASRSFTMNTETLVYDGEGNRLSFSALEENALVRVIYAGDQAYYVEVLDESLEMETIRGDLVALDIENMSLVLERSDGTTEAFSLTDNAAVTDSQGLGVPLSSLTEGSELELRRVKGVEEVSALVLLKKAFNDEGTGVLEAVDSEKREITFVDKNGKTVTYPVANDAKLMIKDEEVGILTALQRGDTFEYVIKDSVVVSVKVTVPKYVTVSGAYQGHTDQTITLLVNQTTPDAYLLQDNVEVIIEGLEHASLADLQIGDIIQLRMSGSSEVVDRITVTNRNIQQMRVEIIDLDDEYITVQELNGKRRLFEITNRTQFRLDGTDMPKNMFSTHLKEGRIVTISVTADQLIRVDVMTKVSGVVTSLSQSARTITVKTDEGASLTVPYVQYVGVEIPRTSSSGINSVNIGDRVELNMNVETNTATWIRVERSFVYTLQSVNASTRTLTLKDYQGLSTSLSLGSNVTIYNRNGMKTEINTLKTGQPLIVNYLGSTVIEVKEAAATRGVVSTLDISGERLAITDYNKNVKNIDLSKGITIQDGTVLSASLDALRLNDRVQLVTDAQGKPYLTVADVEIRKFSAYDAKENKIRVKVAKLGDQREFELDPNVHVQTSTGGLLTLSRLRNNDEITMYILNGKVIEIVRNS